MLFRSTLIVVAVVIFGVPRGEVAEAPEIDVAAEASALSDTLGRPVLSATVPEDWRVTAAPFDSQGTEHWTVAYAPPGDSGFLRVAQGSIGRAHFCTPVTNAPLVC